MIQRRTFFEFENMFVFYVREYQNKEQLRTFCEAIADSLESLFTLERIGAGIGVVELIDEKNCDADLILKMLLIASEIAAQREDREFSICVYDAAIEKRIYREQEIKRELTGIASVEQDGALFL